MSCTRTNSVGDGPGLRTTISYVNCWPTETVAGPIVSTDTAADGPAGSPVGATGNGSGCGAAFFSNAGSGCGGGVGESVAETRRIGAGCGAASVLLGPFVLAITGKFS